MNDLRIHTKKVETNMYELFEDTNLPRYTTVNIGQVNLLKRTYQREVHKVIDYFGNRVTSVLNNHILNRLIVTGCPALTTDLQKFVYNVKIRANYLADNLGFTSASNYGVIHKGHFYGGASEIILHDNSDFDEEEVYGNWRDADAVRVLTHPFTDYKLVPPMGQLYCDRKGVLVTLSVNIAKLMVQYKGFLDSRLYMEDSERMLIGSAHFIRMHVLPNILKSHVDFVLYNRLKDIFYTLPNYECIGKLPFAVIDYRSIADDIAGEIVDRFKDKPYNYGQFLQSVPGIFSENMLESLRMPDEAKTKQVWWALFLSRLEDMFLLMHLMGSEGVRNNSRYYEKFMTNCKWFLRDNTFKSVVSNSIYSGYLSDMKEVI